MSLFEGVSGSLRRLFPGASSATIGPDSVNSVSKEQASPSYFNISSDIVSFYNNTVRITYNRGDIYKDVKRMDDDEIIGTILDMIAEDSTQYEPSKKASVWVNSKNTNVYNTLTSMFKRINIEDKKISIIRNFYGYGDHFNDVFAEKGKGVISIAEITHPSQITRLETDGMLSGFVRGDISPNGELIAGSQKIVNPWEVIHWYLPGKQVFDDIRTTLPKNLFKDKRFDKTSTYGYSGIGRARKSFNRLDLAYDMLELARIRNSLKYVIHELEVGDSNKKQMDAMIGAHKRAVSQNNMMDTTSNSFRNHIRNNGLDSHIVIPVKNGKGSVNTKEIGGNLDVYSLTDVEKFEDRFHAAINVPKDYIYGTSESSINLLQQDIRYARKVLKSQNSFIYGLKTLCLIHLAFMNDAKKYPVSQDLFDIMMVYVSTVSETERVDLMKSVVDFIDGLYNLLLKYEPINKYYLLNYLLQTYLNFPGLELDQLLIKNVRDDKSPNGDSVDASLTPEERRVADDFNANPDSIPEEPTGNENVDLFQSTKRTVDKVINEDTNVMIALNEVREKVKRKAYENHPLQEGNTKGINLDFTKI